MTVDAVELHHDYVPNWPSMPGTVVDIVYHYGKVQAVKVEYYNGGKRWYNVGNFKRNFTHYTECTLCVKGDNK